MATSSIFRSVSIRNKQLAKSVLKMLERAERKKVNEHILSKPCKDIKGEDIKKVLEDFKG